MESLARLSKIGEGTYGTVYLSRKGQTDVAVKRNFIGASYEGVGNIRELSVLTKLKGSPFTVDLLDVSFGDPFEAKYPMSPVADKTLKDDKVHFVLEYIPNCGEKFFANKQVCTPRIGKLIMCQLLLALEYIHSKEIIHRDLKPSNILISMKGEDPVVKICDFGMSDIHSNGYAATRGVTTSWYRSPEVCFGSTQYDYKVDIWSLGCIAYEIFGNKPFLYGADDTDQSVINAIIARSRCVSKEAINKLSGNNPSIRISRYGRKPSAHVTRMGLDQRKHADLERLMCKLLAFDPDERASATQALNDPYFAEYRGYIDLVREKYKPTPGVLPVHTMKNERARLVGVNILFTIFNERYRYRWYSHRVIFHALDVYERWIKHQPEMNNMSSNDLGFRMYVCLYMSHKYFSVLKVPVPWNEFFPANYVSRNHLELIPTYEIYLLKEVLKYQFYQITLAECPSFYNHLVTEQLISKLLSKYGKMEEWKSGSIRALYRDLTNTPK